MKKDFISNLISILAISIYSMSITDLLTIFVLASATILNIITILEKIKKKDKRGQTNEDI